MSDAVIVLREECILAAEGKAGRMPKITKAHRIPVEGFGNTMEQWKKALETCLESLHADHVKLVLPGFLLFRADYPGSLRHRKAAWEDSEKCHAGK